MKTKSIITIMLMYFSVTITAQELLPRQGAPLKIKEFGVGFTDLKSFSMQYRWGNEHTLYRLSGTIGGNTAFGKSTGDGNNVSDSLATKSHTDEKTTMPLIVGAGLNFGILKLKPVTEKFGFFYGLTFGVSYSYSSIHQTYTVSSGTEYLPSPSPGYGYSSISIETTKETKQSIQPNIGIALGGFYKITPSFWLYAEINPSVFYAFNTTKNSDVTEQRYYTTSQVINNHTHTMGLSNLTNSLASLTLVYRFGQ